MCFYRWVGMIHNWEKAVALCETDRGNYMLHRAVNEIAFGFGLSDLGRLEGDCHVTYAGGHLIHMCEVEGNHGPQVNEYMSATAFHSHRGIQIKFSRGDYFGRNE